MRRNILLYLGAIVALLLGSSGGMIIAQSGSAAVPISEEQRIMDSLIRKNSSAVVIPFEDTLFTIYGNMGSISATQRAETVTDNIRYLAKLAKFYPDSVFIKEQENSIDILYKNDIIIGVTKLQARLENKPQDELTQEYKEKIISSVQKEKASKQWFVVLKRIFFAILVVVVTWFLIKYLNVAYRWLKTFVKGLKDKTFKKIYFLLDADKQIGLATMLLKILRFFLVILILYFCVLTFFRLFPSTRWLSDTLVGYITEPLTTAFTGIKNFIPNLFKIIVIIVLFRFLIKGLKIVAEQVGNGAITIKGFHKDWAMSTFNIAKVILFVFMIIFIFPYIPGGDSKAFQGVSVFMGVLFSLGSTSVISNMVSGLVITYMRPFTVGDRIKMGEYIGDVIEKTPLVTRLKTSKNEVITIPNALIMSADTVNYTTSATKHGLILYASITVGYEIDWRIVQDLMIEAALNTPLVLKEPQPFILQTKLDDFYAIYQINVYTNDATKMANIYSDLNKNILDVFNREGIEMLSPHVSSLRDASSISIPKEYVKTGFEFATPFPIKVTKEQIKDDAKKE